MERLWTTFRWDQTPPDGYVGDQDDSAPSVSTSGAIVDQDEPKGFSAPRKTGFLSEEINFFTKINKQRKQNHSFLLFLCGEPKVPEKGDHQTAAVWFVPSTMW